MPRSGKQNHELLIPIESSELLWEWHIPSDKLYITQGTCEAFSFSAPHIPTSMTAFLAHIPAACQPTLHELREGVLNCATGSFLEATYPFDKIFVRERMVVLARDASGRAVRAMGQYTVSSGQPSYIPPLTTDPGISAHTQSGHWHCSISTRQIILDSRCVALLGYPQSTSMTLSLDDWKARMHPEEGENIGCRHALIFEQALMGDTIEDTVRVRLENNTYASFKINGAVLQRNDVGKALQAGGTLQCTDALHFAKEQTQENGSLLFAINATGDGLWDWDSQTDTVYYSPRYLSMLGYTSKQFGGTLDTWKAKIHPDDHDKIVEPQQKIVASPRYGDTFECTYRILCADGTWAWILGRGYVTHRTSDGRATRLVGLHTNITSTQTGREQLEDLVKNDPLTGLRSRNFCDMEIERIERNHIRPISIISCDVNGLKLINDYMGHAMGDQLLRKMGIMLRQFLRATDCVARMGGDEFIVLLPGCTKKKAQTLLQQTEQFFAECSANPESLPVYVSFGMASTDKMDVSVSKLLMEADRQMLRAKDLARIQSHRHIKKWIENRIAAEVSLEDKRYEC